MMSRPGLFKSQSGVVLVVSLIMLLLLTLIGLSGMQSTGLEEKMAGNMRDRNVAFQAAEAGLRDAQFYLNSGAAPFNPLRLSSGGPFQNVIAPLCANGLCPTETPAVWEAFTDNDWRTSGLRYGANTPATALVDVAFPPRYIIEYMGPCVMNTSNVNRCFAVFRLTVRAWGQNATTVVQLQTLHRIEVQSFAN
ncbi:PilX N-terminal domain-containing pilus assembly protein [Methyloglobulus sp.]|uniref:pilus assembly PilX family protein n=1 Tax=Methyloglobulus sp. TaxID=2518622 RepID=UPI0032B7C8A8